MTRKNFPLLPIVALLVIFISLTVIGLSWPKQAQAASLRLAIPSYWSADITKYDHLLSSGSPAGTVLMSCGGFASALPWYANDNPNGGPGAAQSQTRDPAWAAEVVKLQAAGQVCLTYIALNGCAAGTGFDGHYTDQTVIKGKIDLLYRLYPESDGVFFDEGAYNDDGCMIGLRDYVKSHSGVHGTFVAVNLAGYQQSANAINYGDLIVTAETAWDASSGFGGPYFAITDPGNPNYEAQPSYVTSQWPASKVAVMIFGLPNDTTTVQQAVRNAQARNVGNVYFTDRAAYFDRWSSLANDPLWTSEKAALGTVTPTPTPTPTTPISITAITGLVPNSTVSGILKVAVTVAGPVTGVTFDVAGPGSFHWEEGIAPYTLGGDDGTNPLGWDSKSVPDGNYTLTVTASGSGGFSTKAVPFVIRNTSLPTATPATMPTATPTPSPPSPPPSSTPNPSPSISLPCTSYAVKPDGQGGTTFACLP